MKKTFSIFAILLLLLAACGRPVPPPPAELGPDPTPANFTLQPLGSTPKIANKIHTALFAGQVQLHLFLRTDDPACQGSIPEWNALHHDFAPRGLTLIGIIHDDRDPTLIAQETRALQPEFPIGLATDPRLIAAFGGPPAIRAIPTAFLLARDGTITHTYSGHVPLSTIRTDITHALDTP